MDFVLARGLCDGLANVNLSEQAGFELSGEASAFQGHERWECHLNQVSHLQGSVQQYAMRQSTDLKCIVHHEGCEKSGHEERSDYVIPVLPLPRHTQKE